MAKKFKKSYRLGSAAGLLTGIIFGIIGWATLPLFTIPGMVAQQNLYTFFTSLFGNMISGMFFGVFIVALINVLPTRKIFTKAVIFDGILFLISMPIIFFVYEFSVLTLIASAVQAFLVYPAIFAGLYIGLAKNFPGITKFSKVAYCFLVFLLVLLPLIAAGLTFDRDFVTPPAPQVSPQLLEQQIFQEVNNQRAFHGQDPLQWDSRIHNLAAQYTKTLALRNDFTHNSNFDSFESRLHKSGIFFFTAGENLYMGPSTNAKAIVDGWISSPSHRSLIVDRDGFYTHGAVAVHCEDRLCYVALNTGDFIESQEFRMAPDEFIYVPLNDPALGLESRQDVTISIEASQPILSGFLHNRNELNRFFEGEESNPYGIHEDFLQTEFQHKTKHDEWMIILPLTDTTTRVSYRLEYN